MPKSPAVFISCSSTSHVDVSAVVRLIIETLPRNVAWAEDITQSLRDRFRASQLAPLTVQINSRSSSALSALVSIFVKLFGKKAKLPAQLVRLLFRLAREIFEARVDCLLHAHRRAYRATRIIDRRYPFLFKHSLTFDPNEHSTSPQCP